MVNGLFFYNVNVIYLSLTYYCTFHSLPTLSLLTNLSFTTNVSFSCLNEDFSSFYQLPTIKLILHTQKVSDQKTKTET